MVAQEVRLLAQRSEAAAHKIAEIVKEMLTSRDMLVRRLREGVEFFQFLRDRQQAA